MKKYKIFSALAGLLLTMVATSCEGEKDLIIIEGNLPIKTNVLYMLGDATPNGWDNGNPTAFTASEADPLVFNWEGKLNTGEIKLCLVPGSWDVPFIRPVNDQREINSTNIVNEVFDMHAGDPDNKWRVTEAGNYRLSFNMRDWTMSTTYLGEGDPIVVEPIETEVMFLVGDATPAGWNIDSPTELVKVDQYTFVYEGKLKTGEMKGYTEVGNWGAPAIRPTSANVKINRNGVESEDFVYTSGPDDKWVVEEAGVYRVTFDLEHWKVKAEFLEEVAPEDPLMTAEVVYMIGDATPGGWGWDNCLEATKKGEHIYSWSGQLATGYIKGSVEKDYGAPFIRPTSDGVEINENGVAEPGFVFTNDPDDKWHVTKAGFYTITFDLENKTITVKYGDPLLDATELYMIGDATPGGWGWDGASVLTKTSATTFQWTGALTVGDFKASLEKDYGAPFVRPATDDVTVSEAGVSAPGFIFEVNPDNKWHVLTAGTYTVTIDVASRTIDVKYLD